MLNANCKDYQYHRNAYKLLTDAVKDGGLRPYKAKKHILFRSYKSVKFSTVLCPALIATHTGK